MYSFAIETSTFSIIGEENMFNPVLSTLKLKILDKRLLCVKLLPLGLFLLIFLIQISLGLADPAIPPPLPGSGDGT